MKNLKVLLMFLLVLVLIMGTVGSVFAETEVDKSIMPPMPPKPTDPPPPTDLPVLNLSVFPDPSGSVEGYVTEEGRWIFDIFSWKYFWKIDSHTAHITAIDTDKFVFEKWQRYTIVGGTPMHPIMGWKDTTYDQTDTFEIKHDTTLRAVFKEKYLYSYEIHSSEMAVYAGKDPGYYFPGETIFGGATINPGFRMTGWSLNGEPHSIAELIVFEMPVSDAKLDMYFEAIPTFMVTAEVTPEGGGSVTGAGPYQVGDNVQLEAIPSRGYVFDDWTFGDDLFPQAFTPITGFVMPEQNVSVIADFDLLSKYNVKLYTDPDGMGNPTLDANALPGEPGFNGAYYIGETFNVIPNPIEHWHFVGYNYEYMCEIGEPPLPQVMIVNPSPYDTEDPNFLFGSEDCDIEITVFYEEDAYVMATLEYVDTEDVPIPGHPSEDVKVYLDEAYNFVAPSITGWEHVYTSPNASGTLGDGAEDFVVTFVYQEAPEPTTEPPTEPTTEPSTEPTTEPPTEPSTEAPTQPTTESVLPTDAVIIPTTEATEAVTEEVVPLGAAVIPVNFDSIYDNMEMPTEEVIAEEETPLADALPQTGQLPLELFYGVGGMLTAIGVYIRRKK